MTLNLILCQIKIKACDIEIIILEAPISTILYRVAYKKAGTAYFHNMWMQ